MRLFTRRAALGLGAATLALGLVGAVAPANAASAGTWLQARGQTRVALTAPVTAALLGAGVVATPDNGASVGTVSRGGGSVLALFFPVSGGFLANSGGVRIDHAGSISLKGAVDITFDTPRVAIWPNNLAGSGLKVRVEGLGRVSAADIYLGNVVVTQMGPKVRAVKFNLYLTDTAAMAFNALTGTSAFSAGDLLGNAKTLVYLV